MKTSNTIRNCGLKFKRQCSYLWDNLEPTDEGAVRYCNTCTRNVYLCVTNEETLWHAEQGHCVARPVPDSSEGAGVFLGEPDPEWERANLAVTEQQEEASRLIGLERAIDNALENITITSRRCVLCGYPMPFWWKTCRICGSAEFRDSDDLKKSDVQN